ncbi:GTP pyrophosphokinase [Rubritalea tangerina]
MFQLEGELEQMAAVLHDVVEDTEWTFEDLRNEGFNEALIEALDCLTRREGESYKEFIDRLAPNHVARAVKIADLEDNMNLKQLERVTENDLKRTAKYHKHWKRLVSMD